MMRHRTMTQALAIVAALGCSIVFVNAQDHPATGGAHRHADAEAVKNPVAADATSIAAGQKLYEKNCVSCHGATGKGDGKMGAELTPKPSDLTDAEWKHGSSDGEIFKVINEGVKNTGMRSYKSKMTEHEMWDVVNYVRSIGPKKSH
jgi:mono/diheme cytochrome c family protein